MQIQLRVTAVVPLGSDMLDNSSRVAALKPAIMAFAEALGAEASVETAIVKSKRELPVAQAGPAKAEVLITPVAKPAAEPAEVAKEDLWDKAVAALLLAGDHGATADQLFEDAGIPMVKLLSWKTAGLIRQDGKHYHLAPVS